MTKSEAAIWNAAVNQMRRIAQRSADKIETAGRRPLAEAFAVAALRQLADDGAALLLGRKPGAAAATTPVDLTGSAPNSDTSALAAAE